MFPPAIESATRCIEVCKANDAPPFEQFFGYAALALAQRAAANIAAFEAARDHARHLFGLVPADERQACESDLAELAA